ncbi:MAG: glycoside hydrolase family 97 protein [Phycisphaerae bacterium]|nr:glycoside hydrolase family 97 protein [Phycisphaerae bacterium]
MNTKYSLAALAVLVLLGLCGQAAAETVHVKSPNQAITVTVNINESIQYCVALNESLLLKDCEIAMTLGDGTVLGRGAKLIHQKTTSQNTVLTPVVRVKSAEIHDQYQQTTLVFDQGFSLTFRLYDDAVAYRFDTALEGSMLVKHETVAYNFAGDHSLYFPREDSLQTHCERLYPVVKLSDIPTDQFCSLPALIDIQNGPKLLLTEADLNDYAGLYLHGTAGPGLGGLFPAVAVKEKQTSDRDVAVSERADYIARTAGKRSFPWRVCVIAQKDTDLLENQTVYKLSPPCKLKDTAWIKPGKVAWDWWNACNIYGVDFKAGVNTETYKYYIDFAAKYGLEYIILDEGWYKLGNLLDVAPGMDMEALFAYAKKKKVGIILWVVWKTLDDQLAPALDQFEAWGAKGIKVDFMQRDDQWMVNYYERVAAETAKRHMMVDFHGSYSPKGLRRAYPNVISREGVKGLENCKWSEDITPEHCVTLPFTRMVAGPMDFTPGAMINAQAKNYNAVFDRPMSMGTRCQQLAMYVIYESPLQMLSDTPTHYYQQPECMEFLSKVPSVWDDTVALDAKVADYALVARRSGSTWYIGAMTDGTARKLTVDLSFLGKGRFKADIFQDGLNADRYGEDFKRVKQRVTAKDTLTIELAPGGGWVARLTR